MANIPTRNNNPGDLKDPNTGQFRVFSSPQEGQAALLNDLQSKIDGTSRTGLNGNSTLADFSNVWAPSSDNNNPANYTAKLANQLGVRPDTKLAELQPKIGQFADAVAKNEGFQSSAGSSTPHVDNWLLGLGGATIGGLGWLAGKGIGAAKGALPTVGALAGEALFPEGGPISAAGGAEVGGALANLIPGGSPPASSQIPPSQNNQVNTSLADLESQMPQASQASSSISQALAEALGTTITGRKLLQDPGTQDVLQTAGRYGFAPSVDQNGHQDYSQAIQKSRDTLGALSTAVQSALTAGGETAPISQAIEEAKVSMREHTPSNLWADAEKEIENQAATYGKNFGDNPNKPTESKLHLGHFQQMKQEMQHGQKFDVLDTVAKKAARKALGFGARATIEKNTKHKEFYNAAMKEESKLIRARKIMEKLNEKKAPVHTGLMKTIFQTGGKYLGLYIGDKLGGPAGAILGDLISRHLIQAVNKKHGHTIFETPVLQKAIEDLNKDYPAVYQRLAQELGKENIIDMVKHKTNFAKEVKMARKAIPSPTNNPKQKAPQRAKSGPQKGLLNRG